MKNNKNGIQTNNAPSSDIIMNKYPQNTNPLFKLKPFRTMSEIEINKLALSQLYQKNIFILYNRETSPAC